MLDQYGRSIDYLRVSITDRCDLRCVYCMPESGAPAARRGDLLRREEIIRLVRILAGTGIRHLRVTGGEPMTRGGCLELIGRLRGVEGIESVAMTSNGLLLCDRIDEAKRAGLSALNLSLDSLDAGAYALLTRGGDVHRVMRTLEQAVAAGLSVKVNAVPVRGFNESGLTGLAALARDNPICVRFIELMPLGCARGLRSVPQAEILQMLTDAFGALAADNRPHGHGPAQYFRPAGFCGSVGFISAVTHAFCDSCNRVRLTADGQLKLCLNHTAGLDLRAMLRGGADNAEMEAAICGAIAGKPRRHGFFERIGDRELRRMNELGG